MKIIALQSENVKKLIAVEIRPEGNLVEITGKNGQGKTSVLDSIWWGLAGNSVVQSNPIRKGETEAKIRIDLGEIVATRKFRLKDNGETTSTITVENKEGARFQSPQALLDGLMGKLSFDPLAFSRMEPKQQYEVLKSFVPEVDFESIEGHNKADYERRAHYNRAMKEALGAAAGINIDESKEYVQVDEQSLIKELEEASSKNVEIERRSQRRDKAKADLELFRKQAQEARTRAEELEKEANALQEKLDTAEPLPEKIDPTEISKKIEQARAQNNLFKLAAAKGAYLIKAEEAKKAAQDLTEQMKQREELKAKKISEAKMPVDGISFGEGMILMNGIPFDQASDAEKLRVSVAIAMAMNTKLKVIRVRDGSLLDEDAMKILSEMADKNDCQVWIERVDSSGKVGFVLEEGKLKEKK